MSGTLLVSGDKCPVGMCWRIKDRLVGGVERAGGGGGTLATQGSPDLQKSTGKQKFAVCVTGVNKIAPNFVTLVATYICRSAF